MYQDGQYQAALDKCFEVAGQISHDYWVVKTYLLMADCYVELENNFQAKATLESIIDNYEPEDELKQEARDMLEQLQEEENKSSRLKDDDTDTELVPDTSETFEIQEEEE